VRLAAAAGLGLGLGLITGLPLGVINVAIVDAAAARRLRYATGLGLGGGAADAVHATLAFVGIGRLLLERPDLSRGLAVVAALVITTYAVVAWRRHRQAPEATAEATVPSSIARGIATGAALTLPNPGALAAWVAVATSVWPHATTTEACTVGGSVGLGSMLWFVLLARGIGRVRPDHPALSFVPRIALVVLVGMAAAGVLRTL
jgi:arginine exporter protein ArgO